jgi:flavin-dependent dehydrogenase
VIHRSELLEILHDACLDSGVELISDSTVTGVEQYVDGVVVQSSTGDHPARVVRGLCRGHPGGASRYHVVVAHAPVADV